MDDEVLRTANRHDLLRDGPAPRFLEGALLGNGGLGAVVTTRPDAVVIHLGHNDVWDERMEPLDPSADLDFATVFGRVRALAESGAPIEDDPWFAAYRAAVAKPYEALYPRPYPCGALILGVDRRRTEVLGHRVDLARGEATVALRHDQREIELRVFVDAEEDVVHLTVPGGGVAHPFVRARLLPDPSGPEAAPDRSEAESALALTLPGEIPLREAVEDVSEPGVLAFAERLPAGGAAPPRRIRVSLTCGAPFAAAARQPSWSGAPAPTIPLEVVPPGGPFTAELRLEHASGELPTSSAAAASPDRHAAARTANEAEWRAYWSRSAVTLSDEALERIWYRNTYFLHCCARAGGRAPGLFGPWSSGQIGTAWHGDYHLNYNTQQVFWGAFSSNRADAHEPYLRLVEDLTPLAAKAAREYWGLPGAAYPHTAYPVPMTALPPPSPIWGWEMCETPWIVQSLWWHYRYTLDEGILRRILGPLEQATRFVLAYLERPDASADDGLLHVFPTVVPELYGLSAGLLLNRDGLADLTLIAFLFRAYAEAVRCAGDAVSAEQRSLAEAATAALDRLPEHPAAATPDGDVFVATAGEDPDVVYNVPVPGMTVFPGEEHGVWSDAATLARSRRSVERQRLEGGNELVFAAMQRVRLGILDVDAFVRQVRYCLLPNGTASDLLLETGGRYADTTAFDFMAGMGVFTENFALPAVVNELLLQSVGGLLRLFPGLPAGTSATFTTLRAVGAFLVSGEAEAGACRRFEVLSERGGRLLVEVPWASGTVVHSSRSGRRDREERMLEFDVQAGETLRFAPATGEDPEP